MAAPSPESVVKNPPPLNLRRRWPFLVDPFPASFLIGETDLNAGPAVQSPAAENPRRWED